MKKLILAALTGSLLFAANAQSDIDKKLDLILNKLNMLEQKVEQRDQEIKELKQQLKQQELQIKKETKKTKQQLKKQLALNNCKNLKVVSYQYKYYNNVLPYYVIQVTLKNDYPYTITSINGNIYFDDKNDGTTFLKVYINRHVTLKPHQTITLKREYMVTSSLEKELKDENPNNLNVYFSITKLEFQNGQKLECF